MSTAILGLFVFIPSGYLSVLEALRAQSSWASFAPKKPMIEASAELSPRKVGPRANGAKELRVWIVEDHVIFRDLLSDYLRNAEGITLVGQSDDEIALLAACARGELDAVVLDLNLTQNGGLAILEKLRRLSHPPPQ